VIAIAGFGDRDALVSVIAISEIPTHGIEPVRTCSAMRHRTARSAAASPETSRPSATSRWGRMWAMIEGTARGGSRRALRVSTTRS
jgi:hypothetical protein